MKGQILTLSSYGITDLEVTSLYISELKLIFI